MRAFRKDFYFTITDVAEIFGVTRYTVYDWVKKNKLKATQCNEHTRMTVSKEQLLAFVKFMKLDAVEGYTMKKIAKKEQEIHKRNILALQQPLLNYMTENDINEITVSVSKV